MATIRERWWPAPIPRLPNGEVDKERAKAAGKHCAYVADFFDAQGVRRQKTFRLKKQADTWLVQTRGQVAAGTYTPESVSVTVGEAIDLWLERATAEGLEYGTQVQYKQHRDHLLKVIDRNTKLARLTQARCEQLRDELVKAHSRPMARKILASFKGVLREAKRRGLVAQNVAADTTIGVARRHQRKLQVGTDLPSTEQFKEMLASADAKARAMLMLAGIHALRISEIRALTWDALVLDHKPSVTISQRADAWCRIGSPKSASAQRTLSLDFMTVHALKEWRLAQPAGRSLVLGTSSDRPDRLGNLQRVLDKVQAGTGTSYAWHAFRHLAITNWIVRGHYDLKTIQHMAGHSTLTLTLDRYGHFVPAKDAHARASEHVAALLG